MKKIKQLKREKSEMLHFRFFYNFNAYLESSLRCDGE